jgi:ABC-2 type transport system permease protein
MIANLRAALWAETLKMRRSKVPLFASIGFFFIFPLVGGLFMIILKDPEAAKSMGLISTKAQLTVGTADWPAFFNLLTQGTAIGGAILFSIVTTWIFGREFSDHTIKELLALPTSRETTVTAKFIVIAVWTLAITASMFLFGLVIGALVTIPGWSTELVGNSVVNIFGSALLNLALMPYVALLASTGRGYMPPFGWTILTVAFAQIAIITGWGDWFPWAVPGLFSGAAGPRAELLGAHGYVVILIASILGLAATYYWWRSADQTK